MDAGELSATIADSIQWSKHKVLNIVDAADHDVWSVNAEASYHEEGETVESALRHSLASTST